MDSADLTAHWDQVYASRPREALTWNEVTPTVSLELIDAVTGPDASVIDVGAGRSSLASHLLARGYQDIAILDVSPQALAHQRAELGSRVRSICADLCAWNPPRQWDLWHDRAVLHFLVDEDQRRAYVRALTRALPSGGHALISTFAPDGPERCSGLPVRRADADDLLELLGRDRFEVIAHRRLVHQTPRGGEQRFQVTLLRHG